MRIGGIYDSANSPLSGDANGLRQRLERRQQCLIPLFACLVYSNGNVSFCPCDNYDDAKDLRLGNIEGDSLSDLYNSSAVPALFGIGIAPPSFARLEAFI
jgi:hypothetical protein